MGLDDTIPETAEPEETPSDVDEQRKSLVANTYSTSSDSNYKDITGWGMSEEEIQLAHQLSAPRQGSAAVQDALDGLYPGGHEEFYSRLQVALGHVFGRSRQIREFQEQEVEPQGSVPVLELLAIDGEDISEYLSESDDVEVTAEQVAAILDSHPDVAAQVFERMQEVDSAEADD